MAIPVALQQFKSAGIYRVVYDKSTILNQDASIMRLVVGYSAQGPFNTPVLVRSISEFKALYGEASKSLEKRGVYFHRLALQCLAEGPVICLNLKKFSGETLYGATIDTSFNPSLDPVGVVELNVEDIYDTTRFWELSAFKLAEISDINGRALDGYISLAATNTKNTSVSFFIRKAAGQKVAAYNVTVNDWYKDSGEDVPEYLQDKLNNKISDFFAEVYFFKGRFEPEQVLASETLKNYFMQNEAGELILRPYVINAYGDAVDTLDALYNDSTSGAISHYIGALIPYFKDKTGVYQALDIQVNNDVDTNNVMMNFNVDLLEDGGANIDLSGRRVIPTESKNGLGIEKLQKGEAETMVLGNVAAPVISDIVEFNVDFKPVVNGVDKKRVQGNYYVSAIDVTELLGTADNKIVTGADLEGKTATITFKDIKNDATEIKTFTLEVAGKYFAQALNKFGIILTEEADEEGKYQQKFSGGLYCANAELNSFSIPQTLVTTMTNWVLKADDSDTDALPANNAVFTYSPATIFAKSDIYVASNSTQLNKLEDGISNLPNVYGTSVSFVHNLGYTVDEFDGSVALVSSTNAGLVSFFSPGDCLLAADGTTDLDGDGEADAKDGYYDNVYVQETGSVENIDGTATYYVKLTGTPLQVDGIGETAGEAAARQYLVRVDDSLNKEIGTMKPIYLEGYVYANPKPASTSMYDKQRWQDFILSALTDYKGIRTGLLNKSDIDYRYVIDTFETYVTPSAKSVLSFLCKEKESAFAILNFPSVRTFVKCPYTSFTDSKGIFNVEYVVKGYNPKKSHSTSFSLPSDSEGASFCAFYTPLKFSDGYVDSLIPSAGLVSNLFIEKYRSRQPYYIIAGPNYGAISASGMTGPDYNYSREELNIIEPYGVNCMVYRPGFGTFINANQTAKQTPKSALSSVNVRELVIYLQDEIEALLQQYQWEFNNQTVRNKIKDKADTICARIQANGGIQDFVNIMDESNNTPEIIDNEMAVLSTHIEPGRGMGKMVHELTLYRTGMMRAAISE